MSYMTRIGNAVVCREPMEEAWRQTEGDKERWCFKCRKRRQFERVCTVPVGVSYYGPNVWIECSICHTTDGDMFPGYFRTWDDD
jgi:hypothetical protein